MISLSAAFGRARKSRLLRIAAALYSTGFILVVLFPGVISALAVIPERSLHPARWYTLLTYAMLHGSLGHFFQILVLTAIPVLILEGRLSIRAICALAVLGSTVGGVIYALLSPTGGPMIGGGLASWGLAGTTIGCFLKEHRGYGRPAQVYVAIAGLIILITAFIGGSAQNWAIVAAAATAGACAFVVKAKPAMQPTAVVGLATEERDSI